MKREKKKEQTVSTLSVKREKATSILFLSAMLLLPAPTWAQHSMTGTQQTAGKPTYQARAITGTVTDDSGEPLVGASIRIKGTGLGAVTDTDGHYTISVSNPKAILVFSYLGLDPVEITASRTTINAKLHSTAHTLKDVEVVSTGYQKISREHSTAAYGFVDSTRLNRQMHTDIAAALEGQVAGLRMELNPNTGEMAPVLRGIGTFSSDIGTQPLIVIDDLPTDMSLKDVNPYNVESVTVLKDAAAASIYGARAANGVIVITTKSGKKLGTRVNVNADWFITTKPNFNNLDLASTSDIIDYQTDVYNTRVAQSGSVANLFNSYATDYYSPLFQLYRDRDEGHITPEQVEATLSQWRKNDYYEQYRDLAWRSALTQRYNISLSQKANGSQHFASFNFENDRNRTINDKSNSFSLYLKSNFQITKWLGVNVGIDTRLAHDNTPGNYNYNFQERYMSIEDTNGNRVVSPYVNQSSYAGSSVNGSVVNAFQGNNAYKSFGFNVLDALGQGVTRSRRVSLRPFVNVEARFLKMLRYNLMYQYEWAQRRSETYDAENDYLMRMTYNMGIDENGKAQIPTGGRYYQGSQNYSRYTLRNQLSFDHQFSGKHHVTAITGLELRQTHNPRMVEQLMYGYNPVTLTSQAMDWETMRTDGWHSAVLDKNITMGGLTTTQHDTRHRYASFYANAGYTYSNKYNLTGSIRWDEADLFGVNTNDQHHPLWSVGAGWNISEEDFMRPVTWLDYLKLRATYGVNGNVDQSSTTYFVATYKTQSNPVKTQYLKYDDDDLPNPDLRWEKTATTNFGVDFAVLDNRINGSIDYYNRHASDLLVRKYMDPTVGAKSHVINNGEMRNRGIELTLNATIYKNRDWNIGATLTYAHNSNKMLAVDHSESDYASLFILSPTNYLWQGTSYNTLWAYTYSRTVNGYPVIKDENGNEMATFDEQGNVTSVTTSSSLKGTAALRNMGTLTPTYNGSLNLHVGWRGLELNAFFVYAGGNKLRLPTADLASWDVATNDITNRWSTTNNVPRLYLDMDKTAQAYAGTFSEWWRYSDVQVADADYIKLRSVSLAYTLPTQWTSAIHLGQTRFSFQVNNLFTACKAGHHIDPESYSMNSGTRGMAIPRTFAIGLSTSF